MFGGNCGRACHLIACIETSATDSWSELVLSSCWLEISTYSAGNVEGCALAEFLDLGILN